MTVSRLSRLAAAAMLALAAGCVPQVRPPAPPPRPAPVPVPTPAPAPPPASADWQDWPRTPGTWRYERDARGTRALFGTPGTDALVVLRCEPATRRLFLSRAGGTGDAFVVRTSALTRRLPAQPTGGTPPYTAAALAPADPLLDAIAFSRGRFTLEQQGAAPLVLPPWAEFARVVEDCRG